MSVEIQVGTQRYVVCPDKVLFQQKSTDIFLISTKKICHQGASNEYHNICFHGVIRKIL